MKSYNIDYYLFIDTEDLIIRLCFYPFMFKKIIKDFQIFSLKMFHWKSYGVLDFRRSLVLKLRFIIDRLILNNL